MKENKIEKWPHCFDWCKNKLIFQTFWSMKFWFWQFLTYDICTDNWGEWLVFKTFWINGLSKVSLLTFNGQSKDILFSRGFSSHHSAFSSGVSAHMVWMEFWKHTSKTSVRGCQWKNSLLFRSLMHIIVYGNNFSCTNLQSKDMIVFLSW